MLPGQRTHDQWFHDMGEALQRIDWLCTRAERWGIDEEDLKEIRKAVDKALRPDIER